MENLEIQSTSDTPFVSFNLNGQMLLKGRSLPEDSPVFYSPLIEWAEQADIDNVHINFRLDYFNTASSKQIFSLLKAFKDNPSVKIISAVWHYEEGDTDSYETGQHFAGLVNIPFEFIECAESEF